MVVVVMVVVVMAWVVMAWDVLEVVDGVGAPRGEGLPLVGAGVDGQQVVLVVAVGGTGMRVHLSHLVVAVHDGRGGH